MKERGWIVAARRRDGSAPSYMKGVSCRFATSAVYVYPCENDAQEAASMLNGEYGRRVYHVFEVEVAVLKPRKVKA